jgi:hypothetical protein
VVCRDNQNKRTDVIAITQIHGGYQWYDFNPEFLFEMNTYEVIMNVCCFGILIASLISLIISILHTTRIGSFVINHHLIVNLIIKTNLIVVLGSSVLFSIATVMAR